MNIFFVPAKGIYENMATVFSTQGDSQINGNTSITGSLTVNNSYAVTSVNGTKAKSAGNVQINVTASTNIGFPNYGSYVTIGGGDFTPSRNGWLCLCEMNNGDYTGGKVVHKASGKEICKFYQNRYPGSATLMCPLNAGETYTVGNVNEMRFYNCRGN